MRVASRVVSGLLAALAVGSLTPAAAAQSPIPIPHITGRVVVALDDGRIAADLCLANTPVHGDSVTIVLNRAFAIERVVGVSSPVSSASPEPGNAAIRHTFGSVRTPDGSVTPICLRYSGEFPVHDVAAGDYRETDDSSVIAFTGDLMRARGISRWHPTTFDPGTGLSAEAVTYAVEIECAACEKILVNGLGAEPGPAASFESSEPRELLLIAGDLAVREAGGVEFIGLETSEESAGSLAATLGSIVEYLQAYVGVPYGDAPRIVTIPAARAPRQGQLWGFMSDPSLVLIGMTVPEMVGALEGSERSRQAMLGFLAHELAHRHFGWRLGGGSAQRDLFGEPFATYLELKAVRHFVGPEAYDRALARLRGRAERLDVPRLIEAGANDFALAEQRYVHAPAALFALEDQIGENAMRMILVELLRAPPAERYRADIEFLGEAARRAGVTEQAWRAWLDGW